MTEVFEKIKANALEDWYDLNSSKWVRIGGGTSGQAMGSYEIFNQAKNYLEKNFTDINLSLVSAVGLMYLEPIVDITLPDGTRTYYGNVESSEIENILNFHLSNNKPLLDKVFAGNDKAAKLWGIQNINDMPNISRQKKIATRNFGDTDPLSIDHYIARGGYSALSSAIFEKTPEFIVDEVKNSGLRGRGGAAFPAGVKWSFLAPSKEKVKYVLCNCEEGDPGAFNDKGIIENDPHTLVEGLILNGYATNSSNGYIFIRQGHEIPIKAAKKAIADAYEKGLLGPNILGSDFSFDMEVSLTGDSYVAGEETALMEAIEGKRSTPRYKPPFPAAQGLWKKPTNINNVKTLSYVPEIIRKGSDWFKSIGTETTSGTAIVCLSGHIKFPGMYEIPMGMTIREVLQDVGGGISKGKSIKVLQAGGPLNGLLGEEAFDTMIDFDAMSAAGASIGSGGIIVGNEQTNIVDLLRNLIAFNQFESCGKCFPCRLGNTHMLEILDRMCQNKSNRNDLDLIQRIGSSMKSGSLCGHGQLGYNPILSAMKYFREEIESAVNGKINLTGVNRDGKMILPTRTRP
ncbi:MAG: NADH-quinone oxidoreductase subunit F [SAR202 cluster bacterium]|nr:NADH-quinone oxidoreductase subunit F [SAR202 cluster bacterium]|tara:strand:- start:1109 stop:2821 length:1713 start_codon:yes stop_codon:yes gene_type:complete